MPELTEMDRAFLARETLRLTAGTQKLDQLAGPLFWNQPDNAMAQIYAAMISVNRESSTLRHVAILLQADEFLGVSPEDYETWSQWRRTREGLLDPVHLSMGIGEGLGLCRTLGYTCTDYHALAIYDAISGPVSREDEDGPAPIKTAWLSTPLPERIAFASYAVMSLMYSPVFGAARTMELIDAKIFTRASVERMWEAGFSQTGIEIKELMRIIRG